MSDRRPEELQAALARTQARADLTFCLDRHGVHLEYSAPSRDWLFRQPEDFLGKRVQEVLPEDVAALYLRHIQAALDEPATPLFEYSLELPRQGLQHYEARLVPRDAERVVAFVRNVTDRRLREEARERREKLAAVGALASGIAHDFNNLLTPLLLNLELAQGELDEASSAATYVRDAARAAQRSAELIRQMLAYAGRGSTRREELDLGDVFREAAELSRAAYAGVRLRCEIEPALPRVFGDPTQLRQVAGNLVTNALQAMGEAGGDLELRLSRAAGLPAEALAQLDAPPAPGAAFVRIEVRDTGPGLSAELRRRVFDPYFTTRERGSGLGLAIVLGVVRSHGGALTLESEPGQGTTFSLFIPAAAAPAPTA